MDDKYNDSYLMVLMVSSKNKRCVTGTPFKEGNPLDTVEWL